MMRLLVDRQESPFDAREIPTLVMRQGHLGEMHFEDCRVPLDNVMGEAGDAARILTLTWMGNRPLLGMAAAGMAQRALDVALEYSASEIVLRNSPTAAEVFPPSFPSGLPTS
jgi:alkylation response protein AidB-like acyl-CoA dehydrogenase